jgi:quaternary ammonium compound-resistance protein SugE
MAWLYLLLAGLFEVAWAVGLKGNEGFSLSRPIPSTLILFAMWASVGLLGLALETLPLGTAYAVWTGIGTVGATVLGIALFGESASLVRLGCIGLIVAGIVGLRLYC